MPEVCEMSNNSRAVDELFRRIIAEYGEVSGWAIIKTIVSESGGQRLYIPDQDELYRRERNGKIRAAFNGANIKELALLWGLSPYRIRCIIDRRDGDV